MKRVNFLILTLLFVVDLFAFPADSIKAKDTLILSIEELDVLFLKKNYALLAQKYNVDIAEAGIRQARLFYNPVLFYENVLYNPVHHKFFDNSTPYGERIVQIQQLVSLGGKRSKLVRLAEVNKNLQSYAFYDLIRVLRFQLFSDYALIYGDLKKLQLLLQERDKLRLLVEVFQMQFKQGMIAGYELTRIQFEMQTIETNINQLVSEITETQSRLRMLIHANPGTFIKPSSLPLEDKFVPTYQAIIDSAISNRPDLKIADAQIDYSEKSLALQRASAIPNITLGATYDRFGNAFNNYTGVNIGLDLPVFNRNQGNIKIAELELENSKAGAENSKLQVLQDVDEAYTKYINSKNLITSIDPAYKTNLTFIGDQAIKNYNQRVINLLDFMDKMRTYKNGQLGLIDLDLNYFYCRQYLNYVSNTLFF